MCIYGIVNRQLGIDRGSLEEGDPNESAIRVRVPEPSKSGPPEPWKVNEELEERIRMGLGLGRVSRLVGDFDIYPKVMACFPYLWHHFCSPERLWTR